MPNGRRRIFGARAAGRLTEVPYQLLFDRNPQPMWVFDLETLRFLAVNDAAIQRYGYSREEFLAMTIREIRPPEDVAALERSLADPHAEEDFGNQWRHRLKDGTLIDVLVFADDIPFGGRRCRLVLAVDVTEHEQTQRQLRTRVRQQACVAELGRRAATKVPSSALAQLAVESVAQMLGVEFAKVLELRPENHFVLRAAVGLAPELIGRATIPADTETQAGYTLRRGWPVVVEDLPNEPRFSGETLLHDHGILSGISVVIDGDRGPFGVLSAHSTERKRFSQQDVHFVEAVAMVLAAAIGRERGEARQRQLEEDRIRSYEETVRRLSKAVEMRDPATGGHIERIGEISALLARRVGLPNERIELLRAAAPMHDVGKIGVPDSILLKPAELTYEERREMERHAEIGHELLSGSDAEVLELAATVALTHHERFDGSGYPRGLAREEIPIEGRIVAVADVFDALTSDRVYRPAFAPAEALEMMGRERGSHFDPTVVDALLDRADAVLHTAANGASA